VRASEHAQIHHDFAVHAQPGTFKGQGSPGRHALSQTLQRSVGNQAVLRLQSLVGVEQVARGAHDSQHAVVAGNSLEQLGLPGGSGRGLDPAIRSAMELRLEQSFGQVRIHTGPAAAEAADHLNARAFTVGSDVVFGQAEYQPHSARGQRLLAHELMHTVQQRATGPTLQLATKQGGDDPLHVDASTSDPSQPVKQPFYTTYVDSFTDAHYDVNRVDVARQSLSHWLELTYEDGTRIDLDLHEISEQGSTPATGGEPGEPEPTRLSLAEYVGLRVGNGGRLFPKQMNRTTTPRLWHAKRRAIAIMEESNLENGNFLSIALAGTMSNLPMGLPATPAPAAPRATGTPRRFGPLGSSARGEPISPITNPAGGTPPSGGGASGTRLQSKIVVGADGRAASVLTEVPVPSAPVPPVTSSMAPPPAVAKYLPSPNQWRFDLTPYRPAAVPNMSRAPSTAPSVDATPRLFPGAPVPPGATLEAPPAHKTPPGTQFDLPAAQDAPPILDEALRERAHLPGAPGKTESMQLADFVLDLNKVMISQRARNAAGGSLSLNEMLSRIKQISRTLKSVQVGPSIKRAWDEDLVHLASVYGLTGYIRYHIHGPGLGIEGYPIFLAPERANQFANNHIEGFMRIERNAGKTVEYVVSYELYGGEELRPFIEKLLRSGDPDIIGRLALDRGTVEKFLKTAVYDMKVTSGASTTKYRASISIGPPASGALTLVKPVLQP
jgi:hypothetical protein